MTSDLPPKLTPLSAEEYAQRRAKSHRIAWALGGLVLVIYLIGLFVPR